MLGAEGNLKRFGGPLIGLRGASVGNAERVVPSKAPLHPWGDAKLGKGVFGAGLRTSLSTSMAVARGWLALGNQGQSQESEKTSSTSQQFLSAPKGSVFIGSHFLHK